MENLVGGSVHIAGCRGAREGLVYAAQRPRDLAEGQELDEHKVIATDLGDKFLLINATPEEGYG